MKRDTDIEATIVAKFVVMSPLLGERARRLWAAAESAAIGDGGDSVVSAATGLARQTLYRAIEPGGVVVVLVPAHPELYSDLDRNLGHHRRYTEAVLIERFREAGLRR